MLMGLICWILLGSVFGFLASKVVHGHGRNVALHIGLGVTGAVIGGWLFTVVRSSGMVGFSGWSLFVSVLAAVVLLIAWHAVLGLTRIS